MNRSSRLPCYGRIACTVAAIVIIQTLVCGIAALPVGLLWTFAARVPLSPVVRLLIYVSLAVPSYVLFGLMLLVVSPLANRLTGTYSPPGLSARIADFEWPLLRWARYMVAGHIVRLFAGALFRGSPLWTIYLRLDGARVGRRVFVNTLGISDHNLLALGDDVVVGADVHIAGHTVEGGMVRTAAVTIGNRVTIGVGSIVSIDTSIGDRCEIGAMSLVPKHAVLEGPAVYVGVPVRRITPGKDSAAAA